jgi:8-oxo-dGTP pyrophosphatase MutT (NUDIX family)
VLGVASVKEQGEQLRISRSGRLSRHIPELLQIFVAESFTLIDDWNRTHLIPEDRLSGLEVLRHMELQRIEQTRRAGRRPQPLAERPVAFAVFHARNQRGEDCYLFEVNKDWRRLNLIGGKREESDGDDYAEAVAREISEELGIARDGLTLTRLNQEPIQGYSLSGNVGSLASYPCVLYGVTVKGNIKTRMHDKWLTEQEIRAGLAAADSPIMVNPQYLSFLLDGQPPRISTTPLSTSQIVESESIDELVSDTESTFVRWTRVLTENKDLLTALLTLVAALIAVLAF